MGSEIYGPQGYSSLWLILGVVLAVLLIGWPVLAYVLTREKRPAPLPPPRPPNPERTRQHTLTEIDRVAGEHASGLLGHRRATQQLSRLVRGFVASTGFSGVEQMDLTQLKEQLERHHELAPLAGYVEVLYPPSFGPGEIDGRQVEASIAQARHLVGSWTVTAGSSHSAQSRATQSPPTQSPPTQSPPTHRSGAGR